MSTDGTITCSWNTSDESKEKYSLATFSLASHGQQREKLNRLQREKTLFDQLFVVIRTEHSHQVYDILEYNEQRRRSIPWDRGGAGSGKGLN